MIGAPPVFILIALIGASVYVFVRMRTTHFDCPHCGRRFKLTYAQYFPAEIFLTRRSGGRRFVTCPFCGTTAMLEPIPDERR